LDINLLTLLIGAIAGAIVSILGAIVALRRLPMERKTAEAEAVASLAKTYSELVCTLRDELVRLELKIEDLEKRDRILIQDVERLRNDLLAANKRIRKLEAENQQLREVNHDLVIQLANEQEKRKGLEEKLDTLIENGQGGQRSEPP